MASAHEITIESLPRRVHSTIKTVGGYWPALNGLARITEELGELAEALQKNDKTEIAEELADVYIITTCIANQYSAKLRVCHDPSPDASILSLYAKAGEIARIINYYEGPKKLKAGETIASLESEFSALQSVLFKLAASEDLDLTAIITAKLDKVISRDKKRFDKQYDPTMTRAGECFTALSPQIADRKIWAAPEWQSGSTVEDNMARILPSLKRFVKISEHEGLDAFVISAPHEFGHSHQVLQSFVKRILSQWSKDFDLQEINHGDWTLELKGRAYYIGILSPIYSGFHEQHSDEIRETIIFLTPQDDDQPRFDLFEPKLKLSDYFASTVEVGEQSNWWRAHSQHHLPGDSGYLPSTQQTKAIILDLDFTLIDASEGIHQCINHALEALDYPTVELQTSKDTIGLSLEETFKSLTDIADLALAQQFSKLFVEKAHDVLIDHTKLFDTVPAFLADARTHGYKLGLVTSKFRHAVDDVLNKFGLHEYFDFDIAGDEIDEPKPHPSSIHRALDALEIPAARALYVGDSTVDAEAAKRAEVNFVGVLTGQTSRKALGEHPSFAILQDLSELIPLLIK